MRWILKLPGGTFIKEILILYISSKTSGERKKKNYPKEMRVQTNGPFSPK